MIEKQPEDDRKVAETLRYDDIVLQLIPKKHLIVYFILSIFAKIVCKNSFFDGDIVKFPCFCITFSGYYTVADQKIDQADDVF